MIRSRKTRVYTLMAVVLIVAYPLSWGPFIYVVDRRQQLPQPARTLVNWVDVPTQYILYPVVLLFKQPAFRASPVGSAYEDYLLWWRDLAEKHNGNSN